MNQLIEDDCYSDDEVTNANGESCLVISKNVLTLQII